MPEIRQFAVEMALGGRSSGTWKRILILRPPSLESRTEHGFPTFPQQRLLLRQHGRNVKTQPKPLALTDSRAEP